MSPRALPVTVAAILMALFSLMNLPGPWWYAIPGAMEQTPMFVVYSGIVLAIVGLVAYHCYLGGEYSFQCLRVIHGAGHPAEGGYCSTDHRVCPCHRAGNAT